eukprot:Amastigsp_a676300_1337.p3 type:complete len:110 gc:universal Amastigsp_a676300_1337:466-137(-)
MSFMNWMMKSTTLCLYISSQCTLVMRNEMSKPLTGLRRMTIKFSARWVRNRMNFAHRICSISSACLMPSDTRTLLIEGSMSTRSPALRLIISGFSSSSFDVLTSTSGLL